MTIADSVVIWGAGPLVETSTVVPVVVLDDLPYARCCAQISADLEAMVPLDLQNVRYTRTIDESIEHGDGGYRCFRFQVDGSEYQASRGPVMVENRVDFDLIVEHVSAGRTTRTLDLALKRDAAQIQNQINRRESWPLGVQACLAKRWRISPEGKDFRIVIRCELFEQEEM